MIPVNFKEQNIVFGVGQPEYQPLPAFKNDTDKGEVITCWKLSFKERLRILFTGKLWCSVMSFNKPILPSFLTTKKSDLFV